MVVRAQTSGHEIITSGQLVGDESSSSSASIVFSCSATNQSHVADSNCSLPVSLLLSIHLQTDLKACAGVPWGHLNKYNESWLSLVLDLVESTGRTFLPGRRWSSRGLHWTAVRVCLDSEKEILYDFWFCLPPPPPPPPSSSTTISNDKPTNQRTNGTERSPGRQFVHNGLPNGVTTLIIMRYGAIMNYVAQK